MGEKARQRLVHFSGLVGAEFRLTGGTGVGRWRYRLTPPPLLLMLAQPYPCGGQRDARKDGVDDLPGGYAGPDPPDNA